MEPLETLRTKRYWMAKRALLDIPIVDGALSPETFTQVVLYTDAQATIATLQARVRELEQAVKETHGRFISEQAAKKDVIDELTVALKSDADGQVLIDKLMQDVLKLESQLTQRTAELERVRGELATHKETKHDAI